MAQSLLLVQLDEQLALVPLQTPGKHVGLPVAPAAAGVQVPSALAPSAAEHTSHEPLHAVSQHTPSTQLPEAHTRHWSTRQSAPALASQAAPCAFWVLHTPPGAQ